MSIRENFFAEKLTASLWDVAVSMKRGNALPLDVYSVFDSYSALESYINPGEGKVTLSYPGQIVAVVGEDSTSIYYLDQNLDIQPVGIIPSGDNKTIEVTTEGAISLLGASEAANGTIPMIDTESGELVWKTLEDIGAGDGNDNTTYEFAFANEKITITPKFNGIAQNTVELDLSLFATANDLATAREEIDADVKIAKDRADEAYDLAESKVSSSDYAIDKKALEDEDAAIRKIAEDAKARIDTFLDEEGVADVVDSLHDLKVELDKLTDATELADALANKADKSYVDDELAKKQDVIAENTYDEYGAAAQAKADAIADAEGKIATAKQEVIDDAAGKYATTEALGQLETNLDARLNTLETYDHSTYATKGAVESNTNSISNLTERLNGIVAQGGEPNTINTIKVNGVVQAIDSEKAVNIEVPTNIAGMDGYSTLVERITEAKAAADQGVTYAGSAMDFATANKEAIDVLDLAVQGIDTVLYGATEDDPGLVAKVLALELKDKTHDSQFTALNSLITENSNNIIKITTETIPALESRVATVEGKINTLNETTIPALENIVNTKANKADVYTKTELNNIIGSVEEGKTIAQMIADAQSAATYDDSEIRALVGVPASEGVAATGLYGELAAEVVRATAAEQALAKKLENVGTVMDFVGVINTDELPGVEGYHKGDVIIHKAQEYVFDGEAWQAFGDASINAALISALDTRVEANENAILAINNTETGILAQAKSYTNEMINGLPAATANSLGMVKVDDETIKVDEEGTISVKAVSTDLLIQGAQELILMGGSAST